MQIAKEELRRDYELTYVVPATYTESELMQLKKDLEAQLKKLDVNIKSTEDWGKKPLAYAIKQTGKTYTEAYFRFMVIDMKTSQARELDRLISLNTKIIRHLLVLVDATTDAQIIDKKPGETVEE